MTPDSLTEELRARRNEAMSLELEAVAMRLFQERGFTAVTVNAIAKEAGVSPRTFYRAFPSKEDVFQLWIDRRTVALREALDQRPPDEPAFLAVRRAIEAQVATEDQEQLHRWIDVVAQNGAVMASAVGGIQIKNEGVLSAFIAERLDLPPNDLVPMLMAAAFGRALVDANARWYAGGGDLSTYVVEALDVLQKGLADVRLGVGLADPADTPT